MRIFKNVKEISGPCISGDVIGKPYLLPLQMTQDESASQLTHFHFQRQIPESVIQKPKDLIEICPGVLSIPGLLSTSQASNVLNRVRAQLHLDSESISSNQLVIYDDDFANNIWSSISDSFTKYIFDVINDTNSMEYTLFDENTNEIVVDIDDAFSLIRCQKPTGDTSHYLNALKRDSSFVKNRKNRSLYTVIISLSNETEGRGGVAFHLPKNPSTEIPKGSTIKDEITFHGNIYTDFQHFIPSFNRGDAIVFKQDVLHEYLSEENADEGKYIIKGNIMFLMEEENLSFGNRNISEMELSLCADYFNQARRYEKNSDLVSAGECLERAISIRRFPKTPTNSQDWSPRCPADVAEPHVGKDLVTAANKAFSLFSIEIWHQIISFISDYTSISNLCTVFEELSPIRKELFFNTFFMDTLSTSHHVQFTSDDAHFIYENKARFAKTAALYSITLLGDHVQEINKDNSCKYFVSMDKVNGDLSELTLNDLLFDVFEDSENDDNKDLNGENSLGAVFKVRQKGREKNLQEDLFHSVDRGFMATHYNCQDIGIDVNSELNSNISWFDIKAPRQNKKRKYDSSFGRLCSSHRVTVQDRFKTYFPRTNTSYPVQDQGNLNTLTGWDKYFEFWKDHNVALDQMRDDRDKLYDQLPKLRFIDEKKALFMKSIEGNEKENDLKNGTLSYSESKDSGPFPGAIIVRKLEHGFGFERGSCLCLYGENVMPALSKNCSTQCFNHLILDQSVVKIVSSESDMQYGSSAAIVDEENSIAEHVISKYILFGESNHCTIDKYNVDFLPISKKECKHGYESSDNYANYKHQVCQCTSMPAFCVESFVGIAKQVRVRRVVVYLIRLNARPDRCIVFTDLNQDVEYATTPSVSEHGMSEDEIGSDTDQSHSSGSLDANSFPPTPPYVSSNSSSSETNDN